MAADIDVSAVRPQDPTRQAPLYLGMWGLLAVESMVFASLVSTYFYLRFVSIEWPPDGTSPPSLLLPTINTVILLASIPLTRLADRAVRADRRRRLVLALLGALALAVAFLVIKAVEVAELGFRWDSHAYGSAVFALIGFHALHVIAVIIKTVVIVTLAARGYFTAERNLGIQVNGLYWYFVVAVWIPLYAIVYLSPRVLP